MEINICHRLIKNNIENGVSYIVEDGWENRIPKGVYATREYTKGEIIRKLQGKLILKPTRESIHIGNDMHVIDDYGKFINHSFEPNIKIEINNLIALKDIKKYEEITFNYNETEINMAEPFEVNGIKVCGKEYT